MSSGKSIINDTLKSLIAICSKGTTISAKVTVLYTVGGDKIFVTNIRSTVIHTDNNIGNNKHFYSNTRHI